MSLDLNALREVEFAQDEDLIYLNHAAVGPWPRRSANAAQAFAEENTRRGAAGYPGWNKIEHELRERLAELINAPGHQDIALLKSTSEALSVVAYGLDWRQGDNIVSAYEEFPSNRLVWESLADQGVSLRTARVDESEDPEQALIELMDENTRLLTISSVQFAGGLRLDLKRLGDACRERGVLYCVDAIQSVGAHVIDVQAIHADFLMADGHKWMLSPEGVALFYSRPEARDKLRLHQYGWRMVEHVGDYNTREWQAAASARRFECGSPNMLGIHAMHASIGLLLELGMPNVEQALLDNARRVMDAVAARPALRLVTREQAGRYAGIVNFLAGNGDQEQIYKTLMQRGVICAQRGPGVRFSPHFYTPPERIDRAFAIVDDVLSGL